MAQTCRQVAAICFLNSKNLTQTRFSYDDEVKEGAKGFLNDMAASWYDMGTRSTVIAIIPKNIQGLKLCVNY